MLFNVLPTILEIGESSVGLSCSLGAFLLVRFRSARAAASTVEHTHSEAGGGTRSKGELLLLFPPPSTALT